MVEYHTIKPDRSDRLEPCDCGSGAPVSVIRVSWSHEFMCRYCARADRITTRLRDTLRHCVVPSRHGRGRWRRGGRRLANFRWDDVLHTLDTMPKRVRSDLTTIRIRWGASPWPGGVHPSHAAWWGDVPQWVRWLALGRDFAWDDVADSANNPDVWSQLPEWCRLWAQAASRSRSHAVGVGADFRIDDPERFYSRPVYVCPRCWSGVSFMQHKVAGRVCDDCWEHAKDRRRTRDRLREDKHAQWRKRWDEAYRNLLALPLGWECYEQMYKDERDGKYDDIHAAAVRLAFDKTPGIHKTKYERKYDEHTVRAAAGFILARASGAGDPPALLLGPERRVPDASEGEAADADCVDSRGQCAEA